MASGSLMMDMKMQFFSLGLAAVLAGSFLLPVSGFCASRPVSPILMPFGQMSDDANTVSDTGNGASSGVTQVIRGRVVSAVPGAHDTEGVLRILPANAGSGQVSGMDVSVPNNASIQRSEEVEKVSGETGIAFFRHIHVGDVVAIDYSQAQGAPATAVKAIADKVEILSRG